MKDYTELDRLMDKIIIDARCEKRFIELSQQNKTKIAPESLPETETRPDVQIEVQPEPIKAKRFAFIKKKDKVKVQVLSSEKQLEVTKQKVTWFKAITNVLFYMFLALVISVVGFSVQEGRRYIDIMGYSPFYVETGSMNSVIPRGSLIISKSVDPESIVVGDDITFYDENTTQAMITHRVIKIHPNYDQKGLAFETKGVDNKEPDKDKVLAKEVAGKVVVTLPGVGVFLSYIRENLVMVGILTALSFGTLHMIGVYIKESNESKSRIQA